MRTPSRLLNAVLLTLLALLSSGSLTPVAAAEAAAPAAEAAKKTDDTEQVVYITRTGKRYHRAICQHAKIKSTLKEAKELGLTPCKVCEP